MTDAIVPIDQARTDRLDRIRYTRCPVPTASGVAAALGWLTEEFGRDGLKVEALQDVPRSLRGLHNGLGMPGLFREGGNIPALAARAEFERTGRGYKAQDVHAYFRSRAEGRRTSRPKASRWRR